MRCNRMGFESITFFLAFTLDKMIMRLPSKIINIENVVLSSDLHIFYNNCSICGRAKLVA